jgi:protein tyrosine phosphatase (PTP) superfamily phosphohydrolase (DUF442 family)
MHREVPRGKRRDTAKVIDKCKHQPTAEEWEAVAQRIAEIIAESKPAHACQFTADDIQAMRELAKMFRSTKEAAAATGMRALQAMFWFLLLASGSGIIYAVKQALK